MAIINTNEARMYLEKELEKTGFFDDEKNWEKAWTAYKNFSEYQINCADDAFLWETGTFNFSGEGDKYHYSIVRQFSHNDENGEYDHMEQLHFTFYFEPNDTLLKLGGIIWSYDFGSLGEFFAHVESMDSFKIPSSEFWPIRFEIFQGRV